LIGFAAYYGIYVPAFSKEFIELRKRERELMDEAAKADRRKSDSSK